MKNKEKVAVTTSNIFSGMGATAAMCCAGPGLVGCAASCAPACGSLGYSIFGVSSSALTSWLSEYWYIFLVLSILSFIYAAYKIYWPKNCAVSRSSKLLFMASLVGSVVLYGYSFLTC